VSIWEDRVLPRIVDVALGSKAMGKLRRRACEGLSGEVLEVGFGSGRNIPYYPSGVARVRAVDPATLGRGLAARRIAASPVPSSTPAAGNTELPTQGRLGEVRTALEAEFGPIAEQAALTTIGPVVTADLIGQALILIVVGSLAILIWMGYRFRDLKFGASAIAALLHDIVVVIGLFAILGTFLGLEIDALFVTAMLTVIGFSVHDTIVVFDRIRENKARHAGEPFDRIVNHSILQTAGRSITTSLTVVITLLSLILFAGEAIGEFGLALLLGIVSGTYSSIFNAAQILVVWQHWEDRRRERALSQAQSTRRAPA